MTAGPKPSKAEQRTPLPLRAEQRSFAPNAEQSPPIGSFTEHSPAGGGAPGITDVSITPTGAGPLLGGEVATAWLLACCMNTGSAVTVVWKEGVAATESVGKTDQANAPMRCVLFCNS